MADLVVEHLCRTFGGLIAVDDVSFTIREGEFLTLLGPSGCGKSTTLAAIAGLDTPTSGLIRSGERIFFDSARKIDLPAESRNCGLVFQSYALWPHMTVWENLAFPLKLRKVGKAEQKRRIDDVLAIVEMIAYSGRYPHELSGGQQQRVALARTLVYEPAVLLLDEPLSNLDAKLREKARSWLDEMKRRVRRTTLYVTHDQVEALSLSDRIVVMNHGKVVQIGTPREIYEKPNDPFVADFIGTSSFLRGELKNRKAGTHEAVIALPSGHEISATMVSDLPEGRVVMAALRPERLRIVNGDVVAEADEPGTLVRTRVVTRTYLGGRWQYMLELGEATIKVETLDEFADDALSLWIPMRACIVFDAADERNCDRLFR